MMAAISPVILAGGAGTRLWPVSRETMPKHLARLIGDESLMQLTAKRALNQAPADRLITVASRHQDLLIRRQLASIDSDLVRHRLLEPKGRNTAAAIALAALYAEKTFGGHTVLWVCPSDHLIGDEAALKEALRQALPVAEDGALLTFGIEPTRPETGYGYIRTGAPVGDGSSVLEVERFVEKPDLATAESMLAKGGHVWNSGMFLFRADRILEELGEHEPTILDATRKALDAASPGDDGSLEPPLDLFGEIPAMPIDKAVMERAKRIAVVPCDPDWTDLGSWHSIWEQAEKDENGNAARGDVLLRGAKNCLVHASKRLVTLASVSDLAVIETEDAILVVDRKRSEPVKEIVADLNGSGRGETLRHRTVDHSWGRTAMLDASGDANVRRLEIDPGQAIDLAVHDNGFRHMMILAGRAQLEASDGLKRLEIGESVDLPSGESCRLTNIGDGQLRIVEISSH
jgi:mannose-1-phosphate guanylyltransferase/mannose-6-phosphate isomerase